MPAGRTARGSRRPSRGAVAVLVVLLLGLAAWSVAALRPPAPQPADAPATEFSAGRAVEQVRRIAAETHVAGSEASARVVDDLVATLTALGLDTRVQSAVGTGHVTDGAAEMARVRTVVGVLPGTDSTGRLFLLAHHDSAATGPGATGAAGVAALLESVRALTAGAPLRNDVVVVLTDADEACRCGAEAFAASHPLAQEGGVVLSVDPRGGSGPAVLVETSPGDAGLAAVLAVAEPPLVVSSATLELHRARADDSGFGVLLDDGRFAGLDITTLDGAVGTRTAQDLPDRLHQATLQGLGDSTLATARALGDHDLRELDGSAASGATALVLGEPVRWSESLDRVIATAALLGVGGLVWLAGRWGLSWGRRTAAGAALTALPLILGPLAVSAMWSLLVAVRPGYAELVDPWRPGWYRLAAVALVLAVVLIWYALLRRRVGDTVLAVGGLIWLALLAAVLAVIAPGAAHLAALPALAGAAAVAICCTTTEPVVRIAAVLFAGGVAVVVLVPAVALSFPVVGLSSAAVPAVAVTLLALALLPVFELLFPDDDEGPGLRAAAVPLAAAALAGVCVLAGLHVDRFDPAHPVPSSLAYALDADRQQAWWVSTERSPGDWTGGYLSARGALPVDVPYLAGSDVAFGTAEAAALPAARVESLSDAVVGSRREISVRVTPQRPGVRLVALDLSAEGGTVARARVAGRGVPEEALGGDSLEITFHAPPADGLEVSFSIEGGGPVSLRVVDGSTGLDGLPGLQPRPDGVGAAGATGSDLVLVSGTTALG